MVLEFKMPKLGESVTEGTIGRWLKQPGDKLEQYEAMLEVTTDKVDTEVSSPINGTLVEIVVPEGETVPVGTVIARLSEDGEMRQPAANETSALVEQPDEVQRAAPTPESGKALPLSPVVARLAAEYNIDLRQLTGTGKDGRITKKDIEAYIAAHIGEKPEQEAPAPLTAPAVRMEEPAGTAEVEPETALQQALEVGPRSLEEERAPEAAPAVPEPALARPTPPQPGPDDELVPITAMRRAIAEHMIRSKQTAPHVTTVMEADLSRVVAHHQRHQADFERQGVRLTFTPYFIQASVAALQEVPIVNASRRDEGILLHRRIHIGIAVAIPDGLLVPVIKDADEKSLLGLARAVNDLAERARTRQLQLDETQGGTFTITNHGVSGSLFATPIIHQPQAAILGVGAIQKRVVVVSQHGLDAIAIRPMCYLSLSFDHRLIDGATADAFLSIIKRTLEAYEG
jgi:2-oxoisovalerate dehydrogenase E2 component (dihydrolipoyl transacylase)